MYFLIGSDGREYGPVPLEKLREWQAQNRVNDQTRVRPASGGDWLPFGQVPGQPPVPPLLPTPAVPPGASPPPRSTAGFTPNPAIPSGTVPTSGLAIASFVLGLLGFCVPIVTVVPGIILGLVGRRKIRASNGTLKGRGLALAGIIIAMVALGVQIVSTGFLLPAFAKARHRPAEASLDIRADLKQLALGVQLYAGDHDQKLPPAATWCDVLQQGGLTPKEFLKAGALPSARCSYGFNERVAGRVVKTPDVVLLFELDEPGWNVAGGPSLMRVPHGMRDRITVAFVDGSVREIPTVELNTLRWDP